MSKIGFRSVKERGFPKTSCTDFSLSCKIFWSVVDRTEGTITSKRITEFVLGISVEKGNTG